jgi:glutathione-regulated potassium-efflux system ancillary protein KefG
MERVRERPALPARARAGAEHKVLVLLAHPALHRSRVNRPLAAAARSVPGVTVHDLYEAYPDHDVDVAHEQELLAAHEVVVLQHPFYWYSAPSLVKEWLDLVLRIGWAYGPGGTALRGKAWGHALSTGGPEAAYGQQALSGFTLAQFLVPFQATARLCGMDFLPPLAVHGTHRLDDDGIDGARARYAVALGGLVAGRRPVAGAERLDSDLGWASP